MELIYIDFEYCQPAEKHPNLVCASWNRSDAPEIEHIWLYKNKRNKKKLHNQILDWHEHGYVFCSFAVTAEARCFYALGLDPATFKWIDLYVEWRQLRNGWNKYNYGTYFVRNMKRRSVPPVYQKPHLNKGRDNYQVPYSLEGACAHLLKTNIDLNLKIHMRDLILSAPEEFTLAEECDIMEYCDSDIYHLAKLDETMLQAQASGLHKDVEYVRNLQLLRGRFSADAAVMESTGIPLHMKSIINLRKNVELAKDQLITDLVENHFPFFVRSKKRKSDLQGMWQNKYSQFVKYIEENMPDHIRKNWKLTDSGRYCSDDEYLQTFDNIPALAAYRQTGKLLNQLKWLRKPDEGKEDLFDSIGSDGRLRTFFGIFGTQTARNAPATKRFIFAMSAWLRCLIRPPAGKVIVELDYGSQEFAIGAVLSKDPNMLAAYESGDPYLYFAKKAKAVPEDGTKKKYKAERNLFKSTTLGLQYGMAKVSLAVKLSMDTGKTITEAEAERLINLHKRTYRVYWRWLERTERKYRRNGFLQLPCGWVLFKDNPSALSVRNFPTQGAGSSVIREAVRKLRLEGMRIIATLHDSCYLEFTEDIYEVMNRKIDWACKIMSDAFKQVLDTDLEIRIDIGIHRSHEPWISEKGSKYYELLKEYLEPQETREDICEKLVATIFS